MEGKIVSIGWIKLHRGLLNNPIFKKPDYLQIWLYILLKVNHEEAKFIWNNEAKIVKKGSGIFSQKEMAKEFKFPISKINRILLYLKNENQISFIGHSKYTEIEVLNWKEYQELLENGNQKETKKKPKGKQEESNSKPEGNQKETNKNDNNNKNEENDNNEKNISSETSSEVFENNLSDEDFPEGEPIKVTYIEAEEKKEESSAKEEKADLPAKQERTDLYSRMVAAYNEFYLKRTDLPAKFDGMEGKAIKSIMAYFKTASKDKSDDGIVNSWNHLLSSWDTLDAFTQSNLRVVDINSKMGNIIAQLKKSKKGTIEKLAEQSDEISNYYRNEAKS